MRGEICARLSVAKNSLMERAMVKAVMMWRSKGLEQPATMRKVKILGPFREAFVRGFY